MARRFAVAVAIAAAITALPTDAGAAEIAGPGGLAGLRAQAERAGRVRVLVELKVGPRASRRHVLGLQHRVVGATLGGAAWRERETGKEPNGVTLMRVTPMFAASVTAAELERLAANHRVRRIREDGRAAPAHDAPPAAAPTGGLPEAPK